jgi:hypothetical protein
LSKNAGSGSVLNQTGSKTLLGTIIQLNTEEELGIVPVLYCMQIYGDEEASQSQPESSSNSLSLDMEASQSIDLEPSQSLHLCMEETQAVTRSPPDMFQVNNLCLFYYSTGTS